MRDYHRNRLLSESSTNSDSYIKRELEKAEDTLNYYNADAIISNDYKSITFRAKSGEKLTMRIEKVLVPEYHLIDDFGEDVYVAKHKTPDELALQIIREYRNN